MDGLMTVIIYAENSLPRAPLAPSPNPAPVLLLPCPRAGPRTRGREGLLLPLGNRNTSPIFLFFSFFRL